MAVTPPKSTLQFIEAMVLRCGKLSNCRGGNSLGLWMGTVNIDTLEPRAEDVGKRFGLCLCASLAGGHALCIRPGAGFSSIRPHRSCPVRTLSSRECYNPLNNPNIQKTHIHARSAKFGAREKHHHYFKDDPTSSTLRLKLGLYRTGGFLLGVWRAELPTIEAALTIW